WQARWPWSRAWWRWHSADASVIRRRLLKPALEGHVVVVRRIRSSRVPVNFTMLLALVVSACSSGAPAAPSSGPGAPATPQAAEVGPTAAPLGSTAATSTQSAANGAQAEQRSVQAGGDPGAPASQAPPAPIVARSKTTGRP